MRSKKDPEQLEPIKRFSLKAHHKKLALFMVALFVLIFGSVMISRHLTTVDAAGADDFVTTWRVEASDPKITINTGYMHTGNPDPSTDADYNYTIYWGDGSSETVNDKSPRTHTYASAGDYQVRIEGTLAHFSACYNWNPCLDDDLDNTKKLVSVDQWGTNQWKDMSGMFAWAENMVGNYTDAPDTSQVHDMEFLFAHADSFNSPVNFDTSNVTTMTGMFSGARSFNQPINFNTSSVTNMGAFLHNAVNFDQPINLDTSSVVDMTMMFAKAHSLSHPIILDTSSATDMAGMFYDKRVFNQTLHLSDTSHVTNMSNMFAGSYFNGLALLTSQ